MQQGSIITITFLLVFSLTLHAQKKIDRNKNFVIPPYFVGNCHVYVEGPFDGDGSNTFIKFDNSQTESFEVHPIIESKNKLMFKTPDTYGRFELMIAEKGNDYELFVPVRIVHFKLEYNKTDWSDKSSKFKVTFLGSDNMDEQFVFSVQNKSPYIIGIMGGNSQKKIIKCHNDAEDVSWEVGLTRVDKGEFLIMGSMEQPVPSVAIPINQ